MPSPQTTPKTLARRTSKNPTAREIVRATGRAAKATGRAIKKGAKRAAPKVAHGLRSASAALDRWAENPASVRWRWCTANECSPRKYSSIEAAQRSADRAVPGQLVTIVPVPVRSSSRARS